MSLTLHKTDVNFSWNYSNSTKMLKLEKPLLAGHQTSHATHVQGILGFLREWVNYPSFEKPDPCVQGSWIAGGNIDHRAKQRWILGLLDEYEGVYPHIKDMVKGISSKSAAEINAFLKKEGFDIQLNEWVDPYMFGAASVFRLLVNWKKPGKTGFNVRDEYPAFQINQKNQGLLFSQIEGEEYPTLIIPTSDDDTFLFIHPRAEHVGDVQKTHELSKVIAHLKPDLSHEYDTAVIPCVDLDVKPDVNWLTGIARSGAGASVGSQLMQVKQQVRAKMNHEGAFVESATAGAMRLTAFVQQPKVFVVDQPFYMVFVKSINRRPVPLATIRVGTDHWKDPGELHS